MDKRLIKRMEMITAEEQAYLNEDPHVKKEIYTKKNQFEVDCQLFLRERKLITVRRHSRFVEFPLHKHNYIEIVYVCAGELTHYIDGKEIRMQQGDMLLLNQHVEHGVKCAGAGDIGINFIVLPEFFDIPLQMMNKENVIADFLVGTLKQNRSIPQYLNFQLQGQNAISNLMENMIISIMDGNNNEDIINQYSMGLVFLYLINHIDMLSKFYEMDAFCRMGCLDEVLHQIKAYWGGMLERGAVTFWEEYDPQVPQEKQYDMYGDKFGKSLCHAWSASPIYLLGKYFVGLEVTDAQKGNYELHPHLEMFSRLDCTLPAGKKDIYVQWDGNTINVQEKDWAG